MHNLYEFLYLFRMHEEKTSKTNGCPCKHGSCSSPYIKPETKQPNMAVPPGPRGPPLIGQAFNLDTDHMHLQFMEWQKRFGDMFMFKVFGKSYLVISDPDILRSMFVTCEHASRFNDRPASFMGKYVIDRTQDIVFRQCDDIQQTLKTFSMNYVENTLMQEKWFYDNVYEECEDIVKTLEQTQGSAVDITDILDKFSVKVIGLLVSMCFCSSKITVFLNSFMIFIFFCEPQYYYIFFPIIYLMISV